MEGTAQKSWWGRNWKWVVPVGCLTPFLIGGCCCGGALFSVFGFIKSSEAYVMAVERVKSAPAVKEALGEPIEVGLMTTGNVQLTNDRGSADLEIPISGPKGTGRIYAQAKKEGGNWAFTQLRVQITGHQQPIDLLEEQPH